MSPRQLTADQIARIRAIQRVWESGPPPCGISHADIFNPCLPRLDERGWPICLTCGRAQRPAITAGPGITPVLVLNRLHHPACLVARHPEPGRWETSGFPWCTCPAEWRQMADLDRWCGHCGQPCGDYAGGSASVPVPGGYMPGLLMRVCHPNASGRPDCYRRITVYREPLGALLGRGPKPAGIEDIRVGNSAS